MDEKTHSPSAALTDARFFLIARRADPALLLEAVEGFSGAGLRHVEITLDSDDALSTVARLRERFPRLTVGVGTVLQEEQVREAFHAGAQFVVSPHGSRDLAEAAQSVGLPYIPAAYTPTEIVTAWSWGVPLVKLFPAVSLGTEYLRQIRGPLPDIPLVVTGGVTLVNAVEYVRAGAQAVGMGSELLRSWKNGSAREREELLATFARVLRTLHDAAAGKA